jgi:N utilization substance protein A
MQKLRAAKRDQIAEEYRSRIGELIAGTVKKVTRENIILELGNNAEALLRRSDMLPREIVRVGDRVRAYLQDVRPEQRGPQLIVSRTCSEMLIELFKIEVPEIGDGLIELKGAARDPGARAKIAVLAKDNRIDPIGACVGMRGTRVQAVSGELGGERVDIVLWNENPAQYVINAIAPAEVASIIIDDDAKSMDVVVSDEQLSAAIGRNGQNIRLASILTGWELNVISQNQAQTRDQEEFEKLSQLFIQHLQVTPEIAENLIEAGFTSIEEIAYVPAAELMEVEGMDESLLATYRERAKDSLLTKAIAEEERLQEDFPNSDLLEVEGVDKQLAYLLASNGIVTKEDLAEQSVQDLLDIDGMDEDRAGKLIMAARAHWFIEH